MKKYRFLKELAPFKKGQEIKGYVKDDFIRYALSFEDDDYNKNIVYSVVLNVKILKLMGIIKKIKK